jgi:hypothetical protein
LWRLIMLLMEIQGTLETKGGDYGW